MDDESDNDLDTGISEDDNSQSKRKKRVLIIDHKEKSTYDAVQILEKNGFEVVAERNVQSALETILDNERFDAILINPLHPVLELDDLISSLKKPIHRFCKGIPIVTAWHEEDNEDTEKVSLIGKGKEYHGEGHFFHVPTPYQPGALSNMMYTYAMAWSEDAYQKLAAESENRKKRRLAKKTEALAGLKNLFKIRSAKGEVEKKAEEIMKDPESMVQVAFQRLHMGDVESAEVLFDRMFELSETKEEVVTVFESGDTDSTNDLYTLSETVPGGKALVVKRYVDPRGAEAEFHAYRRLFDRNQRIQAAISVLKVHKKFPFNRKDMAKEITVPHLGLMPLREARALSLLPQVNILDLFPSISSDNFMRGYIVMEKVGPAERIEDSTSLTYFNLIPEIDKIDDSEFNRAFRMQQEFLGNEFLAYVQHDSLLVPYALRHQVETTEMGEDFAKNTKMTLESLGITLDPELERYITESAKFVDQVKERNILVSARDSSGRNYMYKPRPSSSGRVPFNFDDLEQLAKVFHHSFKGSLRKLRARLRWTFTPIDYDKTIRFTHEFEDRRNDVSMRVSLTEDEQIISDYHMLLQQARFDTIDSYRRGGATFDDVRKVLRKIKDLELGKLDLTNPRIVGNLEKAIFNDPHIRYTSMDSCNSDFEVAAIHRNSRTARHIVIEYVSKDPSEMEGAKKHFGAVLKNLELQLDRIGKEGIPPVDGQSAVYGSTTTDYIAGIRKYGLMAQQLEAKSEGHAKAACAAKIRVMQCAYKLMLEKTG